MSGNISKAWRICEWSPIISALFMVSCPNIGTFHLSFWGKRTEAFAFWQMICIGNWQVLYTSSSILMALSLSDRKNGKWGWKDLILYGWLLPIKMELYCAQQKLCDEEERVAEGRASQLYCLVPGTQWLCSHLSPQATMAHRFLPSVLSPLTTDLHGPSSHLQGEYRTYRLEALSQQAPLQKK